MSDLMAESYDIAHVWAQALSSSADVAALCQTLFGKRAMIMLGAPYTEALSDADAPYILVLPAKDEGGFEEAQAVSMVAVVLGVASTEDESLGQQNDIEILGYRLLRTLEKAVTETLKDTEFAPSSWEGETARPGRSLFERALFYSINQDRTI